MHFKKAFPGKYMQAADLDEPVILTVKEVRNENIGQGDNLELKPVVHWHESAKPVVLNMTRGEALAEIARTGEMNDWPGTRVLVRRGTTRFQGKKVPCIEFAAPPSATSRQRVHTPAPGAEPDLEEPVEEPADETVGF